MESEIRDLLGHVLQRLDKLQQQQDIQQRQSQLDHVIEPFDTVQNVLETQKQKHQLMSEKLDQINLILKEQLRYSDILMGINVLQSKLCDAGVGSSLSQSAGKAQIPQFKDDMKAQFEETVKDFHKKLNRLDEKVETINNLFAEKRNDDILELQNDVKTQIRAEFTGMRKNIDLTLSDMSAKMNEELEMINTKLTELNNKSGHVQDTLCDQQVQDTLCDQQVQDTLCDQQVQDTLCDQQIQDTLCDQQVQDTLCDQQKVLQAEVTESKLSEPHTAPAENVQQTSAQNVKSFNTYGTMKDLETCLGCQVPVTNVSMNDDTKAEFNNFCEKIKEQVMGRIQLSEAQTERSLNQAVSEVQTERSLNQAVSEVQTERSLNQAVNELKQYLDTTNSQTKDMIQSSFQKQMEELLSSTISQLKDQIERNSCEVLQCSLQRNMAVRKEVTKVKEIYGFDYHGKIFIYLPRVIRTHTPTWHIVQLSTSVQACYYFTKEREFVVNFWLCPHRPLPKSINAIKIKLMIADNNNQHNKVKRFFVMNGEQNCNGEIGRVACDDLITTLYGSKDCSYRDAEVMLRCY